MSTQFIINDKGEKTAAIIPIAEYEDIIHSHRLDLELTDEYKIMIDEMIKEETEGRAQYVNLDQIIDRFNGR